MIRYHQYRLDFLVVEMLVEYFQNHQQIVFHHHLQIHQDFLLFQLEMFQFPYHHRRHQ